MFKTALTVAGLTLLAAPALAGGTQPAQHGVELFAYEANVANYCPAGTQPVRYNGVVCCGTPTATGYVDAPVTRRYVANAPVYAPERIPMGKSPDSWDGS
ncbi:hypothetical protein [Celeribacter sp.]|uniref:hypothetical protein n=1 Tax=Celeribacter sp. TaxID=1890673 RepID=UPI003A94CB5C